MSKYVKLLKEHKGVMIKDGVSHLITIWDGTVFEYSDIEIKEDKVIITAPEGETYPDIPIESIERDCYLEVHDAMPFIHKEIKRKLKDYQGAISFDTAIGDILAAALADISDSYIKNEKEVKNLRCF